MEKEYAIGIDLGGTSVKYALIDNNGVFYFQGKLPSNADVSAEAVIGQLVKAVKEVKNFAEAKEYTIAGIGIGTPGIVDCTNRIVLGGAENIQGWENLKLADRMEDVYKRQLLTATVRADGSTVFSNKNKWGFFPSFSAAWRVSEEAFMKIGRAHV